MKTEIKELIEISKYYGTNRDSGLSYNIRFDTQPRERDRIFQFADVRVFVDPKSFIYLHGMTLDYQETLMQQGFVFVNPNASKSCGCGTSFSG